MTEIPYFSSVPQSGRTPEKLSDAADAGWVRRIVDGVNKALSGKINVVLPITLTASAGTTTVIDARIGAYSAFLYEPLTTNAFAAWVTSPYIIATDKRSGQATLAHVNDANADKSYNLVILG